jgi:methionyl-tRNA formyltransferase
MKLVYLGTPEIAVPPLRALHGAGHEIALVVSGVDKRRGRGRTMSPSPVKAAALELGLRVSDDPDDLMSAGADLGVVVAYGRLLRPHLVAALDMVNLHFSLLPRWRGAAPVERAILAGDPVTGVCLMAVEDGLDTGCVYDRAQVAVGADTSAAALRAQLVDVGTSMLVAALDDGLGSCVPQEDDGVTYAAKLTVDDLRLDWDGSVVRIDRVVRVGGAWTTFRGERFKVHAVSSVSDDDADRPAEPPPPGGIVQLGRGVGVCAGDGLVRLVEVQPAGKGPMPADAWANGARPFGECFGETDGPTGGGDR